MSGAQGRAAGGGAEEAGTRGGPGRRIVVRRREQLAALERDWKRLHRAAGGNPFLSWEWQRAWLEAQPRGVEPWIVAEAFAEGGGGGAAGMGALAGLWALQRVRRRGLRQLEFLGQGSGGDALDCLLHPAADAGLAGRLVKAGLELDGWDLLRLESARPGTAMLAAVADWGGGSRGGGEAGEWLPYLPLPESWEALLGAHSANFRAEVRRRRRQFERLAPDGRVECAETPGALGEALEHVFRLHNLRRAQKRGRGIFESGSLRGFHRRAVAGLGARGGARIYLLRTTRTVVAALYGLAAGDRFLYFQSGFDPEWTAASPGTVLLSQVLEDCIRRGEREFEFLRGDEGYKGRWTGERRRSETARLGRGLAGRSYELARAWRRRLRGLEAEGDRSCCAPGAVAGTSGPAGERKAA